jgi:gamma-glutamyltranspeptidase/glutathione hydrolase
MVYRKANGETGALDYREKAPLAAVRYVFDENGNVIEGKSTASASLGSGTLAGLFEYTFGTLPISEILAPVIAIAKKRGCSY